MIKTTYQTPELRDANDNVVQEGAFGKNTALSNSTNDGWIDYVMNNLEALHETVGDGVASLDANGHVVEPANIAIGDEDGNRIKNSYLKLTGGTMSGAITTSAVDFIKHTTNDDHLTIMGGTAYGNSASILLNGGSASSNGGAFQLLAQNGSTNKTLLGKPDGQLTWDSLPVPVIGKNAGGHNCIFRGKNLGTSLTSAQISAIQAGTFDDMFIGDYWVINGVNWRIGMFDPWYNVGDTNFNRHHLGIVPDTVLYSTKYNETNTTEGGYVGSELYSGLGTARTTIKNAFGDAHIPTHRVLLPTSCTGGKYTSWAWRDEDIMLMTEVMVYGTRAWGDSGNNGYSVASQDCQWPLFALSPQHRHTRQSYWLQDVSSASSFASVYRNGLANINNVSTSVGVRPAFALI